MQLCMIFKRSELRRSFASPGIDGGKTSQRNALVVYVDVVSPHFSSSLVLVFRELGCSAVRHPFLLFVLF